MLRLYVSNYLHNLNQLKMKMKIYYLLPLFLLATCFTLAQSINRNITKVNVNGTDYNSFPINYVTNDNSPLSVTVYFTYQKTDNYNHSYGAGGKFFINNNNLVSFTVPNLDNNQSWSSSVNVPNVSISNVNSLDLKVRITTQAPFSPNPSVRDYDTQTVRINVQQPISNNTISAPQYSYNYNSNLNVSFTGSQPTGGNGSYSYQWYKKKWNESSYNEISGATHKDLTTNLTEHTSFRRKVTSAGNSNNSPSKLIKVLHTNIDNNYIGYGSSGPSYGEDGASNETVNGFIVIGDAYYASGRIPRIPTIDVIDQSNIWQYQWQNKVEGGNWIDIPGATSQEYTIQNMNQNTYLRRKAISDHLLNNPKYSNLIYVTVLNQSPVGNNTITLNQNDPYAYWFEGSTPSGGDNVNYIYSWYVACAGSGLSTVTQQTEELDITPTIDDPYPTNKKSLSTYIVMQYNNNNLNQCSNGISIKRRVKFLSGDSIFSSDSNILQYGVQNNYVNVSQQQSNLSNIIMNCVGLSGSNLRLEISRDFGATYNSVLTFIPSINNFTQTWTIPSTYGSGAFGYIIYVNNQIIKTGTLWRF